jgi:hypothetical protein
MTLEELESQRATAGATYAAAVTGLHAAMVNLAALDQALDQVTGHSGSIKSFGPLPSPLDFRHPVFAPNVGGHWQTDVANRRNEILANGN